jgi:DNA invertase Pin-like site-specific DNA recombinase
VGKLIGYARVSTRQQSTDRQVVDLLAAGVRRDDLYVDHGVSGARATSNCGRDARATRSW